MGNKIEKFFDRLQAFFGEPYKDADGEAVALLAKHLAPYDEAILLAVAEHFVLTRRFKSWPMPVEIIQACRTEQVRRNPPKHRAPKVDYWATERLLIADKIVQGQLGLQAAEGGWLDELWHFGRKHQRLPEGPEIDRAYAEAQQNAKRREKSFKRIESDKGWQKGSYALRRSLLELFENMQAHSRRREDKVLVNKRRLASRAA